MRRCSQTDINMAQDKDRQIITQSQLKLVMDYSKQIGVNLKLKEVVGVTNVLVDYCLNGYSKEIGDRLDAIDKFIESRFEE
jgi:hypothetical protein